MENENNEITEEQKEDQKKQSSVLKGMKRTPGTIPPKESYETESSTSTKKNTIQNEKQQRQKGFKNQKSSIKISDQIKTELGALKSITKTKFDYEIIELLIDNYVSNQLSTVEKRKYKVLSEEIDS